MALPLSNSTAYVAGTTPAVKAADLNDLQTYLSGAYTGVYSLKSLKLDGVGGQAVSPNAAQLIVGQSALADTPLALFKDQAGNLRSLIDHNGYPVGRRGEYRQEWGGGIITGALFTNPDSISTGGSATYPSSIASRTGGTTNSTNYVILTNALTYTGFVGLSLVLEMDVAFSTLTATNTTLFAGLTDSVGPAGATNLIGFQRLNGGTNWQAVLTGTASVDLGVTPTTSVAPPQRLRLEVHGSSSPFGSGGNGKVRCWVNDTLKGEVTGALPNAIMAICVGAGVSGGAASVGTNTSCGALYMTWNRVLSIPAL